MLCAKTPSPEHLSLFGYTLFPLAGIYENHHEALKHIPLLVLNDLRDEPYNAFVKAFASRPAQKAKAFAQIHAQTDLSEELLTYFEVLQAIWSLPEGATMDEVLTPERVMEIGREWKRILIQHTPADQLNELLSPEYKQQFIDQGIEQKTRDIVLAMSDKGFSLAIIADITALTIEQVQSLLQKSINE